jgi:hypothetical protein
MSDLLTIRKGFLESKADFGKVIVHGHTPVERPEVHPNRIAIDTGAYVSGRLSCAVLENDQTRFLATGALVTGRYPGRDFAHLKRSNVQTPLQGAPVRRAS